ncbi:MAG: N-acetylglucosamine-6-phosphate deacetylase, partial [Eubacteriales bacterium]|nr:N-acetylglucosamine-6-phosphate deacetylase [Eubacteriales bacterium]
CTDMYVIPGFIDTHIHGAYGSRFSDEKPDIDAITHFEATKGVTSIAATTSSASFDVLLCQFDEITAAIKRGTRGAKIIGIHAEGPFLNVKKKGAMIAQNIIPPSIEKINLMLSHSKGYLKLITVAPEIKGQEECIRYCISKGIKISLGHTDATYEEAEKAVLWGATQSTHTFNAMRPYNHREPGVLGCVLTNPKVKCEMICDFVHIHPKTVELIYRLKGSDNINMVSDSGHAAGTNLTEFTVMGEKRFVKDGVVRLEDGTIAGSTKTLLEGVQNLVSIGIPLEQVSKMASLNPAKTLGIEGETGSISVGKYADITVLDRHLQVKYTLVNGKIV